MIHSPTPRRGRRRLAACAATLALTGACLLVVGATPAMAAGPICATFDRAPVSGGAYVVQNNAWGNTPAQCVQPRDGGFTITKAEGSIDFGGAPKSYPSIFAGQHYGEGSNTASLPVQVTDVASARTSATITEADGAWNAAWDIWINSTPDSPGQNDDTEIMVWADTRGGPTPIGTKVDTITVEGRAYDVWKGKGAGNTDVVSYVDAATTTTPDIPLAPFIDDSISRGATKKTSYMTSVQLGFEPWKKGQGLAISNFTYSPTSEATPTPAPPAPPGDGQQPPSAPSPAPTPAPAPGAQAAGHFLLGAASGRCIDVAARSATPGAPVQLWDCQGNNTAQQWARGAGDSVVNAASGQCLDVARSATTNGARVQQWTCIDGAPGQQWTPGPGESLVNPASGRCLDATDENTDNGTRLILWDCHADADNQAWSVR